MRLLQFLCDAGGDASARRAALRLLETYSWRDADNEILFETIRVLFAQNPRDILDHLPAALTRRGFPDLPWEPLRHRSRLAAGEAVALARELRHSAK